MTHISSGKQYVGITIQSLDRRWRYHLEQSRAGHIKSEVSLHEAIRQHGPDSFSIEKIDCGKSKSGLEIKEREWIKRLDSLYPNGFNISTGGTSGGSNTKPTIVDEKKFQSVKAAALYVANTRGVSLVAAEWRLRNNKVDTYKPAAKGKSLVKSPAYKAWSQIWHCVLSPNSKSYNPNLSIYEKWKRFSGFLEDVGQPPQAGMAFARLDKTKGYFPENCVWISKSEASKMNADHMKKSGMLSGRKKRS